MNVHVIRSFEFRQDEFEEIKDLISQIGGPIKFHFYDNNYINETKEFPHLSLVEPKGRYRETEYYVGNSNLEEILGDDMNNILAKNLFLSSDFLSLKGFYSIIGSKYKHDIGLYFSGILRNSLPFTKKARPWLFFFELGKFFGFINNIPKNEIIVLITNLRNDLGWYSGYCNGPIEVNNYDRLEILKEKGPLGPYLKIKNLLPRYIGRYGFICLDAQPLLAKELVNRNSISFEVICLIFRFLLKKDIISLNISDTYDLEFNVEPYNVFHKKSFGCINDLCANKEEIIIKLRTTDICEECINSLFEMKVQSNVIDHLTRILDYLRPNLLTRKKIFTNLKPSRLRIYHGRFYLHDFENQEIKLDPLEKTVYLLFLSVEKGIMLNKLDIYRHFLEFNYSRFKPNSDTEKIREAIDRLINPLEGLISQKIARIKSKMVKLIGKEFADFYIIKGPKGAPKRIELDRDLLLIEEEWLGETKKEEEEKK